MLFPKINIQNADEVSQYVDLRSHVICNEITEHWNE